MITLLISSVVNVSSCGMVSTPFNPSECLWIFFQITAVNAHSFSQVEVGCELNNSCTKRASCISSSSGTKLVHSATFAFVKSNFTFSSILNASSLSFTPSPATTSFRVCRPKWLSMGKYLLKFSFFPASTNSTSALMTRFGKSAAGSIRFSCLWHANRVWKFVFPERG